MACACPVGRPPAQSVQLVLSALELACRPQPRARLALVGLTALYLGCRHACPAPPALLASSGRLHALFRPTQSALTACLGHPTPPCQVRAPASPAPSAPLASSRPRLAQSLPTPCVRHVQWVRTLELLGSPRALPVLLGRTRLAPGCSRAAPAPLARLAPTQPQLGQRPVLFANPARPARFQLPQGAARCQPV